MEIPSILNFNRWRNFTHSSLLSFYSIFRADFSSACVHCSVLNMRLSKSRNFLGHYSFYLALILLIWKGVWPEDYAYVSATRAMTRRKPYYAGPYIQLASALIDIILHRTLSLIVYNFYPHDQSPSIRAHMGKTDVLVPLLSRIDYILHTWTHISTHQLKFRNTYTIPCKFMEYQFEKPFPHFPKFSTIFWFNEMKIYVFVP